MSHSSWPPDGKPVINFHLHLQQPASCISQLLIWLVCCFLFSFFWSGGCWHVLVLCLTVLNVRAWPRAAPPPPPPQLHPHLRIPQVWSNVGRSSSSANWSGMYQPRGKERGGGGGLLTVKKHSSSLFSYLCIPFLTSPFQNHTLPLNSGPPSLM